MTENPMTLEQALQDVDSLLEDQKKVFETAFVAGMQEQMTRSVDRAVNAVADDKQYVLGWNAALEMAATKLVHDFKHAFGADTCASWAAWLKEQKR
jgi:phosphoserine phosphatase